MIKITRKNFMIFGSFSGSNAGDIAILNTLIHYLNKLFPKSRFYVPTTIPSFFNKNRDIFQQYDIIPISMRFRHFSYGFISLQLIKKIVKCDAIFTTANMFFDKNLFNPHKNYIFTAFPVMILYRLLNRKSKIIATAVTINFPTSFLGKIIMKEMLKLHDIVTVRDLNSKLVLYKLSKKVKYMGYYPDIVIGEHYRSNIKNEIPIIKKNQKKLIGINLSSYFEGEVIVPKKEILYGWIKFFAHLFLMMEKKAHLEFVFIMTSSTNEQIASEIFKKIGRPIKIFSPSLYNYKQIYCLIKQLDIYLSMRMHGAIFAFSSGIPCIGLCFTNKLRQFYNDYNLEEYKIDIKPNDYRSQDLLKQLMNKTFNYINLLQSEKKDFKTKMDRYKIKKRALFNLIDNFINNQPTITI